MMGPLCEWVVEGIGTVQSGWLTVFLLATDFMLLYPSHSCHKLKSFP